MGGGLRPDYLFPVLWQGREGRYGGRRALSSNRPERHHLLYVDRADEPAPVAWRDRRGAVLLASYPADAAGGQHGCRFRYPEGGCPGAAVCLRSGERYQVP